MKTKNVFKIIKSLFISVQIWLCFGIVLLWAEAIDIPVFSYNDDEIELWFDVCDSGGGYNLLSNGGTAKQLSYSFAESAGITTLSYNSTEKEIKSGFYGPSFPATEPGITIDDSSVDFGVMPTNDTAVSATGITVTNSGDGDQNYLMRASNSSAWTLGSTIDLNVFVLQAAFNSSQPANTNAAWEEMGYLNTLTTTDNSCASGNYFSIDGSQFGTYIDMGQELKLWLRIKTPLAQSTPVSQNITLTLTAEPTDE